ncbi:MAG: hypothetical protein JSS07_06425 [Proteobacteria bacterium]|nr:hypothetical protein [Pseudomonadota bacterium]
MLGEQRFLILDCTDKLKRAHKGHDELMKVYEEVNKKIKSIPIISDQSGSLTKKNKELLKSYMTHVADVKQKIGEAGIILSNFHALALNRAMEGEELPGSFYAEMATIILDKKFELDKLTNETINTIISGFIVVDPLYRSQFASEQGILVYEDYSNQDRTLLEKLTSLNVTLIKEEKQWYDLSKNLIYSNRLLAEDIRKNISSVIKKYSTSEVNMNTDSNIRENTPNKDSTLVNKFNNLKIDPNAPTSIASKSQPISLNASKEPILPKSGSTDTLNTPRKVLPKIPVDLSKIPGVTSRLRSSREKAQNMPGSPRPGTTTTKLRGSNNKTPLSSSKEKSPTSPAAEKPLNNSKERAPAVPSLATKLNTLINNIADAGSNISETRISLGSQGTPSFLRRQQSAASVSAKITPRKPPNNEIGKKALEQKIIYHKNAFNQMGPEFFELNFGYIQTKIYEAHDNSEPLQEIKTVMTQARELAITLKATMESFQDVPDLHINPQDVMSYYENFEKTILKHFEDSFTPQSVEKIKIN